MTRRRFDAAENHHLIGLVNRGVPAQEIASTLQRSELAIRQQLTKLRQSGKNIPRMRRRGGLKLPVPVTAAVLEALWDFGKTRGKGPAELAGQLLAVTAKDNLFYALLGDEE